MKSFSWIRVYVSNYIGQKYETFSCDGSDGWLGLANVEKMCGKRLLCVILFCYLNESNKSNKSIIWYSRAKNGKELKEEKKGAITSKQINNNVSRYCTDKEKKSCLHAMRRSTNHLAKMHCVNINAFVKRHTLNATRGVMNEMPEKTRHDNTTTKKTRWNKW